MNKGRKALSLVAVVSMVVLGQSAAAFAGGKPTPPPTTATVEWTGQGAYPDLTTLDFNNCDLDNTPYLLFVLSGSKATSASIVINSDTPVTMAKANVDKRGFSTFKTTYLPGSEISLSELSALATYNDAKNKATLTIGHGCLGTEEVPSLTITYLGEYNDTSTFANLGSVSGASPSFKICEDLDTTNCVTFSAGSTPGTVKKLTFSDGFTHAVKVSIDFPTEPAQRAEYVVFHSAAVFASDPTPFVIDSFHGLVINTLSETNNFQNGGNLWVHTEWYPTS